MSSKKEQIYENPLAVTFQFRFCGNPLRCDMYRNCGFKCNYCFAKTHLSQYDSTTGETDNLLNNDIQKSDIKIIERIFKKAFDTNEEIKDITVEFLRHGAPIHCGGMSDPFQPIEFQEHLTYKLIQLSNKYQVPLIFSTKQSDLPEEYWEILNPKLHAFQISLIGFDENWIKKFEPNTPSPQQRLDFMRKLRAKGFWVAMRIQPLIDIEQALKVANIAQDIVNYIIVEHLKVAMNSEEQIRLFGVNVTDPNFYIPGHSRYYERPSDYKERNIKLIQSKVTNPNCKVGVGDNDFHYLSQSRCCCGIDTIGGKFDNYFKYNLTYFSTDDNFTPEQLNELWIPKCSIKESFLSSRNKEKLTFDSAKDYVDEYCLNHIKFLRTRDKIYKYYSEYLDNSENRIRLARTELEKRQMSIFDFLSQEDNKEDDDEFETD